MLQLLNNIATNIYILPPIDDHINA